MQRPDRSIGRNSLFLPQLRASRRDVAVTLGTQKLGWCGYPMVKIFEETFIHFNRIHKHDRQTEGRTPPDGIGRAYA